MTETLDERAATDPAHAARDDRRRQRRVREIDFTRPTKFTKDQQRRIERAHETFCRTAAIKLSTELRTELELEVINVAQLTWAGAFAELPGSSLFAVVRTEPLGTYLVLTSELHAVTAMMERLLGARVVGSQPFERDLTEIEVALARRLIGTMIEELSGTWQELFGLTLELGGLETQGANAQVAPLSEPALALTFETRFEQLSSTLSLLVPYRSIEPVVGRLEAGHPDTGADGEPDVESAGAVQATVSSVDVELRVEVAAVEMPLGDVLRLREGDVVGLGAPALAGVTVYADQVPIHRARPGRRGQRRAVEVLERLEGCA